MLLATILGSLIPATPGRASNSISGAKITAATSAPANSSDSVSEKTFHEIQVGCYIHDLAHLDIKSETFYVDFYIWFRWKGDWFKPSDLEFMNGDISFRTEPSHEKVGDSNYSIMRIKGTFRSKFSLYKYPFDSQKLSILMEHRDLNLKQLKLVPDAKPGSDIHSKSMEMDLTISDWKIEKVWAESGVHRYNTDFGYYVKGNEGEGDPVYSQYSFNIRIKRVMIPYLLKFSLPLLILVIMSFLVFFINAREFEAQCGICVTAILSCIALHLSQGDNLPQVGYLVSADKFFILSYVLIFFTLVETVLCNNFAKKGQTDLASRLDKWSKVLFPVAFVLGLCVLLLPNL